MRTAPITKAGQVSLPAEVRRRWGTRRVAIRDEGDRLIIVPVPDDPIAASRGLLARPGMPPVAQMMADLDERDARAEARPG